MTMSNTLKIRNTVFGEGTPKICVPLTDTDIKSLKLSLDSVKEAPYDLVEWRADHFENLKDKEARDLALKVLREALGDTPLLFTVRTVREGGMADTDAVDYEEIISDVIKTGMADIIDVELSCGEKPLQELIKKAHESGVFVIASKHDFSATPSRDEIVGVLVHMQCLGADIVKYAVTPNSERDVLTLLDATLTMKEHHGETPVITMSMGDMGTVSRLTGRLFGSAVTFGTVTKASAPGQIPADRLAEFLEIL